MGKAIGIDLGTTNSCAAVMEGGRPRIITSRTGATIIPSVFGIDERGKEIVGQEAKQRAQLNPQQTVMGSKRLIGRNFHSKTIEKIRQVFTYELMEGSSSEVLIKVNDRVFTLEQISAAILLRIKDFAEKALENKVDQSVITVPAYFNDRQRQAVRTAGRLAGFKVLRVLNEPTAAALAYGLGRTINQRVAVYDLGGGTFDISVIDIKDHIFEVIATGGDTFLGGVDFDGRVMQWLLERFHEKHYVDLSWDRVAIQRIRDAAEAAKIELSAVKQTRIHIPFITRGEEGPLDVDETLTRDKLEELTADLVQRTLATCERIFREAGTTTEQIDEVLLVGGQSRMPLVQKRVKSLTGRPPSKAVHPDEAVSIGAAIMAHSLAVQKGSDVTLLDVLPMPIGINKVDGTMHVLFPKNQPLPDYKTRTLTTSKDKQRSILLRIYQGESRRVRDNELLGTFVFSGIRPAPKGQVHIEVTFHIDSEGILNLSAKDKETGKSVASTLKLSKRQDKPQRHTETTANELKSPEKDDQPTTGTDTDKGSPPAQKPADKPAEKPAAPVGLDMPASSLAQQISGQEKEAAGTPPAGALPDGSAQEPAAPEEAAKTQAGREPAGREPAGREPAGKEPAAGDSLPSITPSLDEELLEEVEPEALDELPPEDEDEAAKAEAAEKEAKGAKEEPDKDDLDQEEPTDEKLDPKADEPRAEPKAEEQPTSAKREQQEPEGIIKRVTGWFRRFFGS